MADVKTKFRSTYGLDAAGEKIINVALADKTVPTDGVNVAYLIQENTIQEYDPSRTYPKGFAVIQSNRIWIAKTDTVEGPFNELYWRALRTDPKWTTVTGGIRNLESGNYITLDTAVGNAIELTLPSNAQDGDTIVVKDIGGRTGYTDVTIKAGLQSIREKNVNLPQVKMTVPYSEYVFVYVNRLWQLYNGSEADMVRYVNTNGIHDLQSSEIIVRQYDRHQPIKLRFPRYANHGDLIHFVGMNTINELEPYFNLELASYDSATSIMEQGTHNVNIHRSLSGYFVFDSEKSTWALYDSDKTNRLRTVNSDTNLFPNETVAVVGVNNTDVSTITLNLPSQIEDGDQIQIVLGHIRKGQTVVIKPAGTDKIISDMTLLQFPKRSEYPVDIMWPVSTELVYNGATSYPPTLTLAFLDMGAPNKHWLVVENTPMVERVDSTNDFTKARVGVIALANLAQAQVDHENNPNTDTAITPETLAKRVATENVRGIAKIAKSTDVNQNTNFAFKHDLIVTPKTLNEKTATETRRGVAEIATIDETKDNTNDTHIVTPKKLDARRATEGLSGLVQVVTKGGLKSTTRTGNGTGTFDKTDQSKAITPLNLDEWRATETQVGGGYLALDSEVIAGTANVDGTPLIVTPEQLHKKTATETRIGFAEIATQAEVNAGTDDLRFVTPKKLAGRGSTESMTGLAKIATQAEFDAGVLDNVISTPKKIKAFLSNESHIMVDETTGLRKAGNLWGTVNLNIVSATELQKGVVLLSTQALTNAGMDDTTAVTPKKLHAKKSTVTTEGIIRIANQQETIDGNAADNLAIRPVNFKYAIQTEKTWEAQTTVRGTVRMTEGALTWVGDDVVGNTQPLDSYQKTGYAISPYELNKTLANYAPLKSKAVDSDKLDGLDSTQFVRRDVDQTVNGALTLTKPLVNNSDSDLKGILIVGKPSALRDVVFPKIFIRSHVNNAGMVIGTNYSTNGNRFIFGYSPGFESTIENNIINYPAFEYGYAGDVKFYQTVDVDKNITSGVNVIANRSLYAKAGSYYIGSADNIVAAMGTDPNNMLIGNTTNNMYIRTNDANNLNVQDSSSNYKLLTQKNMQTLLNPIYVNKTGDTMSGKLAISAPVSATFNGVTSANINQNPTTASIGVWSVEITNSTIYEQLNGYLVPVYKTHPDTGLPYVDSYDEVKSSGTLSQFGTDLKTTFQMWMPKPNSVVANVGADTLWIRQFNVATNKWGGWARQYTSNLPPTAKDIGAMSNDGSTFNNLRIRDWIQIGNVRLYADVATRSLRSEWID